tara:strand:+ start:2115 stop:2573 length:459 start_codon:yes stop_codon:yes gene_type:complete
MGFKMNGFSGFGNDEKNNEKKGNKGSNKNLNTDNEGYNSPHNVAARETEGTIEEQAENLKNAIKSGHTRLANPSATPKKGPCWSGYEMIGMKTKGGRKVPNCVPKSKKKGMPKNFKPHMMYGKSGEAVKANTMKEHLDLKNKGYGHTKPKNK